MTIAGHKTSFTLEAAFWDALKAIAAERHSSVAQVVAGVDQQRAGGGGEDGPNLSSALRVFVLLQQQAKLPAAAPLAGSA
ncbi:MAG TPA: ribbon-helix-helix domain-containing protein [Dongiaceae bacterium]|nr:ribbon-helix-helix domain-containing protein [Dongiaceae bacterium]